MKENIFTFINSHYKEKASFSKKAQILSTAYPFLKAVSFKTEGDLTIAKYNLNIWSIGFNPLLKTCRGIVWSEREHKVISHPFDKFFNINEVPESSLSLVRERLSAANLVYVSEKLDGSLIAVSNYEGNPLITTNFSFDNEQISWAKEIFSSKYSFFYSNVPTGYTFIFELIHPENRIVVDYGSEKDVKLLAVRNLETEQILPPSATTPFLSTFGFSTPAASNLPLDQLLSLSHIWKNANFEGWVLRIDDFYCKLKLEEYFELHKSYSLITPKWVYQHIQQGTLDDVAASLPSDRKLELQAVLHSLQQAQQEIEDTVEGEARYYLDKYNISLSEFQTNRERMKIIIADLLSNATPFTPLVLKYLKAQPLQILSLPYKKFNQMKEEVK